ncbi:MAG TPA: V-type ATP synthase subunit D [Candidatus Omnitrophica bacterium]|jgi:V/A-type H+-transporting ATPase subunit D|nr:V-type ATP synthase subunit D [Candidatus Omnitrophota bacterium]
MKINIAATKTNLLKSKKLLSLTREGHSLLDEKRRILVNELTSIVHIVDRIQRKVDTALQEAYGLVDRAVVIMGRKRLEELSFSIDIKTSLSISERRVMGVSLPIITMNVKENPPYYSSHEVSFYVDEVMVKFKEALKLITQLAEKKIALIRIAKEVQKTIRKVNALEKIYLPFYEDSVKYINDRLDEYDREAFSMLKLIKERIRN